MSPSPPLAVRLYGWLTVLLPRELRERFAGDATDVFADLHRDAIGERGSVGAWALWGRSAALLLMCAVQARGEEDGKQSMGAPGRGALPSGGWGGGVMGGFLQDLRYGVRTLLKRPGFSLTAILILAAGVGATTTIFSVVDTVVFRELPYPDAGRLVHFDNGSHPYPNFRTWSQMSSFQSVSAERDVEVDLTGDGAPERLSAVSVSSEFFRMFGAAPHLGRLFDAGDYPGDRSVSVLGYGFWQRRWGGDRSVIGRTLQIDGAPTVVVGIIDPDFEPPEIETGSRVDVWFALDDGGERANAHGFHTLGVVGRLQPGVSVEAAQAEVDAERRLIAEDFPQNYVRRDGSLRTTPLTPLREATVVSVRSTLYVLLGAVGLMLLIACANVGNLFLAHGTARMREIALRSALGAGRGRIASQVLTESILLALVGGALGVTLAYAGVDLFKRFNPGGIPRIDAVAVDLRILLFTVLISGATGVLFGLLPALQAMRADVSDALKEGAATATASRGGRRVRSGLVIAEIALAVVLLTGAGLLFRSFIARVQVDPGFDAEQLVVLPLSLGAEYEESERRHFTDNLLERIGALPGTRSVAAGWKLPFSVTGRSRCCWSTSVEGDPALIDEDNPFISIVHPVSPGYFETLGASLAYGREFVPADSDPEGSPAMLNRRAAEALFGTDDALGHTIVLGGSAHMVVGIVDGVHHWGLSQGVQDAVYVPYAAYGPAFPELDIVIRTDAPLETAAPALRDLVWALDAALPIPEITTMERRISSSLATPRFLSGLLGGFAAVALLLACGGVYGSMLYMVGQRRHEMGIRLALGAAGSDVIRLVMRYGLVLSGAGVALGVLAGLSLSGFLERLIWGVEPTDPLTFVAVALVLGGTAAAASFVPAWRASRTDPLQTLRAD